MTGPKPTLTAVTTDASPSDQTPDLAATDRGPDSGALAMAALSNELPEFATVMRGYDRGQVEDYVVRLQEFLHDAELRASNADRRVTQGQRRVSDLERELARASERAASPAAAYDGLGERISTILRLAAEEADSIRATARDEADALTDRARSECDQLRLAAEHDLADISRRRDSVVSELNRVRDVLTALGLSQGSSAQDGTPVEPAQVQQAMEAARPAADDPRTTALSLAELKAAGEG